MSTIADSIQDSFRLENCRVTVMRSPIETPVRTSFGVLSDRPAVLVALSDQDGNTGWGEVWCNFPSCGAEHRARLIATEIAPHLLHRTIENPREVFDWLTQKLHLLVNQTGEEGPVAQAIAGIDMALWDLFAKRKRQPLWRLLGGSYNSIPCYASGINPAQPGKTAATQFQQGFRAFKLKVGFGDDLDTANAKAMRDQLGPDVPIMLDANQAWDLPQALRMTERLNEIAPLWMEEPMPVDASLKDWQELARLSPIPLAGGENLRGFNAYRKVIYSQVFQYIQPDAGKWGGLSGCLELAGDIHAAGQCYCPHWLGGAVGLMASAHLLAATNSDGLLEVDSNPNPLRTSLVDSIPSLDEGCWYLSDEPGHGALPLADQLEKYSVP